MSTITGVNNVSTFYMSGYGYNAYPYITVTSGLTLSGTTISGYAYIYNFNGEDYQQWYVTSGLLPLLAAAYTSMT